MIQQTWMIWSFLVEHGIKIQEHEGMKSCKLSLNGVSSL